MAARRFYAYYVRGSQLALVEYDNVSGSGQTLGQPSLDDIGPSGAMSWKSPLASITGGLEIEYAYSPRYSQGDGSSYSGVLGDTKVVVGGWYIDSSNYLNFFIPAYTLTDSPVNSSSVDPWPNFVADEHMLVSNSSRWNGLHKIKSKSSYGVIQTYTVSSNFYNTGLLHSDSNAMKTHTDGYIHGVDNYDIYVNLALSVGDFVNLTAAASGDSGLYKVTSISETDDGTEDQQKAYLASKYFLSHEDDIDEWQTGDEHLSTTTTFVTKVKYDPCYLQSDVGALDDESDTIDLPEYLSKALVYYVKAKLAEDMGDIEQKEYNIREFQRILEKHESSKMWGPRIMVPGSHGIR